MTIDVKCFKTKKGFTLIELIMVLFVLGILTLAVSSTYLVGIDTWLMSFDRTEIRGRLAQALELVTKDLRQAKSIDALTASSLEFTVDFGSGDQSCFLYLHNPSDSQPNPPYSEEEYKLRYTCSSTVYGDGAVIAENIPQPTRAVFSQSGNVVAIDLTASKNTSTVRIKTKVRPRNL